MQYGKVNQMLAEPLKRVVDTVEKSVLRYRVQTDSHLLGIQAFDQCLLEVRSNSRIQVVSKSRLRK